MTATRSILLGTVFTAFLGAMAAPAAFAMTGAEVLKTVNHDGDQTLEAPEVIAAAAGVFKSLSKNDQTVDHAAVGDRVSDADWSMVNKDQDQTLELDEWLSIVRARFTAADANHDGKLDAKELDGAKGQELVKMMVK